MVEHKHEVRYRKRPLYNRNKQITKLRIMGFTLEAIAQKSDLTRERIRQIVFKHKKYASKDYDFMVSLENMAKRA